MPLFVSRYYGDVAVRTYLGGGVIGALERLVRGLVAGGATVVRQILLQTGRCRQQLYSLTGEKLIRLALSYPLIRIWQ